MNYVKIGGLWFKVTPKQHTLGFIEYGGVKRQIFYTQDTYYIDFRDNRRWIEATAEAKPEGEYEQH